MLFNQYAVGAGGELKPERLGVTLEECFPDSPAEVGIVAARIEADGFAFFGGEEDGGPLLKFEPAA